MRIALSTVGCCLKNFIRPDAAWQPLCDDPRTLPFTLVMLVQLRIDNTTAQHIYGVQPHHLLVCNAIGIDDAWYELPSNQENSA
jgi:hypothetical protein